MKVYERHNHIWPEHHFRHFHWSSAVNQIREIQVCSRLHLQLNLKIDKVFYSRKPIQKKVLPAFFQKRWKSSWLFRNWK